jgi:hypothetical protein
VPSVVVSLAGKPQSTHSITRPSTRIGRAPGNDIVLAGATVSSTHAVIVLSGTHLVIEDLESSNGTFLDRRRITRADLDDGSIVSIGDYTLKLVADRKAMAYEPTMLVRSGAVAAKACLQRLDGPQSGEAVALSKVVNPIGKPGECMVTIIRRGDSFAVRFTEGPGSARLNGEVLGDTPVPLNAGDVLHMGSERLQFLLGAPNVPLPAAGDAAQAPPAAAPEPSPLSWVRRVLSRGRH